jgi:ABC-type transport system involved in multi-copper enzyme maturation permease subunit
MRIAVARRNFRGLGHFEKGEAMNAFVKKEIRLLLPSFLAVLALAILAPWFSLKDPDISFAWTPVFIFFGAILLGVDSFGREFSLGTFSSLMSQPIERCKIWRTKITILFFASALVLIAYFISSEILFHHALKMLIWKFNPKTICTDFHNAMCGSGAAMLIALTGGLWTTLLFRQVAAAFWITLIVPIGLLMLIAFVISRFAPNSVSDIVISSVLYGTAVIYTIFGFWFAHRLFYSAQDVAWTGGIISFSSWRYFESSSKTSASVRRQKPFSALLKKEFQLQSISLFCAGALLALHIGVFILRACYGNFHKNELADVFSEFFWTFWLVMPLVIGCMAVAEERKLGVMESQFCLSVSRRFQFTIKFVLVMVFGVVLGGFMPMLLEMLAAHLGAPNEYFRPTNSYDTGTIFSFMPVIFMTILSAALALVGFFASTMARNFLQALSIAIVSIVAAFLFEQFLGGNWFQPRYGNQQENLVLWGMKFWGAVLPILIGILTIIIFIPWLAARNFNHYVESGRLWRRNIFGIVGAILFVFVSSAAIYNRVWEIFEPAEPAHGAAKFSLSDAPKLRGDLQDNIQVRFPDGRIWFDNLRDSYPENRGGWKYIWWFIDRPLSRSAGPEQFMGGSNWISVAGAMRVDSWQGNKNRVHGYLDTVGIQPDGSLWISSEAKPLDWTGAKMIRFGDETNWRQVVSFHWRNFLLLKTDGTLWEWGNQNLRWDDWQTNWPSARNFKPQQIGTNSDWQEIFSTWFDLAKKTNGTVWTVEYEGKTNEISFKRATNYDQIAFQNASFGLGGWSGYERTAYIETNGALWIRNSYLNNSDENSNPTLTGFLQVGGETNWLAVAISWDRMVALKTDGSLWQWPLDKKTTSEAIKNPPTPLGIHHDWVGLMSVWQGTVSLAADGSLWFWPGAESQGILIKLPKQPQLLGNVFGKAD